MRLKPNERDQPACGILCVEVEPSSRPNGLPMRVAKLVAWHGVPSFRTSVLQSLYDPKLVRLNEQGVIDLVGIELDGGVDLHRISEHIQVWRCTPIAVAT